jgi:hypothetical protein
VVSFPVQYVIVPFGGLFIALAARVFAPEPLPELPPPPALLLLLPPLLPQAVTANAIAETTAIPSPRLIFPPSRLPP